MKLYIAEKPSLGRAIADVLPGPLSKENGYIRAGNGDCVSWCIGHLLEQAEPEAYDAAFKQWRLDDLPIIPDKWQLQPKQQTSAQLRVLKSLVKEATTLVHAGDPDREGQLLVDQVISYLGVDKHMRDAVQRCLISDMNPEAVRRALNQLRSNLDFYPLSVSALARSRADWLYGINMTRVYTLQGRRAGYDGVLSVGRVQTPVLGLVVRRDEEIADFTAKPYYEVLAHLQTLAKDTAVEQFTARWQPSESCQPFMDEEDRVLSRPLAENVVRRIEGSMASVTAIEQKKGQQAPPLPYNLSALQIDAARLFGMTAQETLDSCQSLYEKYKLVTYPRSDCRYLPSEHFLQAGQVIGSVMSNLRGKNIAGPLRPLVSLDQGLDTTLRSKAWNDAKIQSHHAIIPTLKTVEVNRLSASELNIYGLIARQYLCQFLPASQFADTRIDLDIGGGLFVAKARQSLREGWKILFRGQDDGEQEATSLPRLKKGQELLCVRAELQDKLTRAPAHFTDATLLSAMTGIARFVADGDIRKILKETDGLGTEATRAGIVDLLFKRGFLVRQGKGKVTRILSTPAGQALIHALPDAATRPDMTAHWEAMLNDISQRRTSYDGFMQPLTEYLGTLVEQGKTAPSKALRGLAGLRASTQPKRRKRGSGRRKPRTAKSLAGK